MFSEAVEMPRGTFVGTPLYVAPEMLNESLSGNFTDLWALGVIVYQMIVGSVPFTGKNQFEVYEKIKSRKLNFPSEIKPDARDLLDRLLSLDPMQRFGVGLPGSGNTYSDVKNHPFFKGFDFTNLGEPPLPSDWRDEISKPQSIFTPVEQPEP